MTAEGKIDWSQCPLVEVNPRVLSGAPVLRGTRMLVNAIVGNFDYGVSVAEISEQFEVPQDRVEAILTYAKSRFSILLSKIQKALYYTPMITRRDALAL